jgi:cysteinyl-tRNA synthetase
MKVLGPSFDLHLGGEDLMFPHHEDEIAQSEGAGVQPDGRRFVQHWLHGAHLQVEGRKMAKSLGNFFTLRDLLARGFSGREIRYLLLTAHYRETFNFTMEGLNGARSALARIDECVGKLRELGAQSSSSARSHDPAGQHRAELELRAPFDLVTDFTATLDEDLNISAAWGEVFKWVTATNKRVADNSLPPNLAAAELAAWDRVNSVLGIGSVAAAEAPAEIVALLEARQAARKAKDFKRSDEIRDELKAKGWIVEDSPKGPKLKKL